MKNSYNAIVFGLAIIIAALLLGNAYVNRSRPDGTIRVTGLGKTDFSSDLVVWEGSFRTQHPELKTAYANLENDRALVEEYLLSKGVDKSVVVFGAVSTNRKMRVRYSDKGTYMGEEFEAYELSRTVKIESKDIEKIEAISREVTELLNRGVNFYSYLPRYYYTKLADLKIDLISQATEDARVRAEKIAENSGGGLGKLVSAQMGVFQITGQNSTEEYSWGGTFNTVDKNKTASITMKLTYKVR